MRLADAALVPVVLASQMMCTVEKYIKLVSAIENQTLNFFYNSVMV